MNACSPVANFERLSPYGWRGDRFHHGVDLFAPEGTAVFAAAAGVVDKVAQSGTYGFSRYGNTVLVAQDDGTTALYAHLKETTVGGGERIAQGDLIGTVGSSAGTVDDPDAVFGHSGPHLHFEVLTGAYPASAGGPRFRGDTEDVRSVDPEAWLRSRGGSLRSKCAQGGLRAVAFVVGAALGGAIAWQLTA